MRTPAPPTTMRPWSRPGAAAALAAAACAGWWAHPDLPPPQAPAPPHAAAPAPVPAPMPLIAVAHDGRATLHVDQQPLEWVLEQIALQSGWAGVHARAPQAAASAPSEVLPPSCPEPLVRPADPARVLQAIDAGSELQRFEGLQQARQDGIDVPEPTLRFLLEQGPSERVRVLAFEAWLAQQAAEPAALRAALESARHAASPAVRQEAEARLEQWHEAQRLAALPALADP